MSANGNIDCGLAPLWPDLSILALFDGFLTHKGGERSGVDRLPTGLAEPSELFGHHHYSYHGLTFCLDVRDVARRPPKPFIVCVGEAEVINTRSADDVVVARRESRLDDHTFGELEADRGHDEEIRCRKPISVVAQQDRPTLRCRMERLIMYLAAVYWAISMPSLSSSPWICGRGRRETHHDDESEDADDAGYEEPSAIEVGIVPGARLETGLDHIGAGPEAGAWPGRCVVLGILAHDEVQASQGDECGVGVRAVQDHLQRRRLPFAQ